MTVKSALFYQNREYKVGTIIFDLILNESHNYNNKVSTHPIEDGADITDHIQNELQSGTISGLITNFSIYDDELSSNKSQDAVDKLVELWKKQETVDIYTVLGVYEGYAITNCSVKKDDGDGESIKIDFSFQEVNKVKLSGVTASVTIKGIQQNKTEMGKQNGGK